MFNPISLQLSAQKTENNNYQIYIDAEDSGIFMIHPWEFGIRKTTGLFGEKFEQKIRNPQGNGLSYLFALDWRRDLCEVVFIDNAKIAAADTELGNLSWENDAGLGLIYYTYLGPIRANIAFNNGNSSPQFNIGFGNSF